MNRAIKRGVTESDASEYIPVKKLTITTVTKKLPVSKKRIELEKKLGAYYTEKIYTQYEYDCNYTNGYHRRDGEGRYLDVGSREFVIACHDHYKRGFDDGVFIGKEEGKLDALFIEKIHEELVSKKSIFSMYELVGIGLVFGSLFTLLFQMIYASI